MRTLIVLACLCAPVLAQTTWYVDAGGVPPGSGTASDPYTSIQYAIERPSTQNGDTLLVAAGTYAERIDFTGKAVVVTAATAERPVIDAQGTGSTVAFRTGEGPGSVLVGFELRGGSGTDLGGETHGGGLLILGASPRVIDVVVADNEAARGGGVAVLAGSSPTLGRLHVEENTATQGGGIYVAGGTVTLSESAVDDNSTVPGASAPEGAGVWVGAGGRLVVRGGSVSRNASGACGFGGGLAVRGATAELHQVVLERNHAGTTVCPGSGGAVFNDGLLEAQGCTFQSNGNVLPGAELDSLLSGGAIHTEPGASSTVRRSSFRQNQARHGGAVAGEAVYVDCVFLRNNACFIGDHTGRGGAGVGGTYERCTFDDNWACGEGGAVAEGRLVDCEVRANDSLALGGPLAPQGGGLFGGEAHGTLFVDNRAVANGSPFISQGGAAVAERLERCVFARNQATRGGAALLVAGGEMVHCTVAHGDARFGGAVAADGPASIRSSILWKNGHAPLEGPLAVSYSIVEGGYPGTGNLASDPLLWGPASGDGHVLSGSPSIDAGDPADPNDPDGTRADIGAVPFDPGYLGDPSPFCEPLAICAPSIGFQGTPSVGGPDDFRITAEGVGDSAVAYLAWSPVPAGFPLYSDALCIGSPRFPVGVATATADGSGCGGEVDFPVPQSYLASQGRFAGDKMYVQIRYRERFFPSSVSGTAALEITLHP